MASPVKTVDTETSAGGLHGPRVAPISACEAHTGPTFVPLGLTAAHLAGTESLYPPLHQLCQL